MTLGVSRRSCVGHGRYGGPCCATMRPETICKCYWDDVLPFLPRTCSLAAYELPLRNGVLTDLRSHQCRTVTVSTNRLHHKIYRGPKRIIGIIGNRKGILYDAQVATVTV